MIFHIANDFPATTGSIITYNTPWRENAEIMRQVF